MDAYDDYHRQIAAEAHKPKDPDPAREMEVEFRRYWSEKTTTVCWLKDIYKSAFVAGWRARETLEKEPTP